MKKSIVQIGKACTLERIKAVSEILTSFALVAIALYTYQTSVIQAEQAKIQAEQAKIQAEQAKIQAEQAMEQNRLNKMTNQPDFRYPEEELVINEESYPIKTIHNEGQYINDIEGRVYRFYSVIDKKRNEIKIIPIRLEKESNYDVNYIDDTHIGKGYLGRVYLELFPYNGQKSSLLGAKEDLVYNSLLRAGFISRNSHFQSNIFVRIEYEDVFSESHATLIGKVPGLDNIFKLDDKAFMNEFLKLYQSLEDENKVLKYENIIGSELNSENMAIIQQIWNRSGISEDLKHSKVFYWGNSSIKIE